MGFREQYWEQSFTDVRDFEERSWINIVSCWECWKVFGSSFYQNELTCPFCKFTEEPCYFPDLFY